MSPNHKKHSQRLALPDSRPSRANAQHQKSSSPTSTFTSDLEAQQALPMPTSPGPLTLACPFYKLNLAAYQSCARLKLSKISYVKQHLIRHHIAPIHCSRCLEVFSAYKGLEAHLRREEHCKVREGAVEGVTEAVREQLSRRSDTSVNEAEQWRDIWRILFRQKLPPSPYIDLDLPEEIKLYNDYLFSKVPERLSRGEFPQSLSERRALVLGTLEEVARDWKSLWKQGRVTAK